MRSILFSIFLIISFLAYPVYATTPIKPPVLQKGDTVGIVSTGFRVLEDAHLQYAIERLEALGYQVKVGDAVLKQYGYFAGRNITLLESAATSY